MAFYPQPVGDNRCGAYCIAYYQWKINQNLDPSTHNPQPGDDAYINGIYQLVVFSNELNNPTIPMALRNAMTNFSNPYKIRTFLQKNIANVAGATVRTSFRWMQTILNYLENQQLDNVLPNLNVNQSAILILGVNAPQGFFIPMIPQHYVFAYKANTHNGIDIIDPATGTITQYPNQNLSNFQGHNGMTFTNTAIYIQ